MKNLKDKLNKLISSPTASPSLAIIELSNGGTNHNNPINISSRLNYNKFTNLKREFKFTLNEFILRTNIWLIKVKINFINSFLIAVDHCKSLHTICATTITIASSKFFLLENRNEKRIFFSILM